VQRTLAFKRWGVLLEFAVTKKKLGKKQ